MNHPKTTTFEMVSLMNAAFGNPKGNPSSIDWERVTKQCANIPDEVGELFIALGANPDTVRTIVGHLKATLAYTVADIDIEQVRDALCDINVFSTGAQHFMGVNGDADMEAVIDGVMTRFVKNEDDLQATLALHRAKGVTDVYVEGEYPTAILKSASDQPDAPKGKFLKSASYKPTVFPPLY